MGSSGRVALVLASLFGILGTASAESPRTETLKIRGRDQTLRLYGSRSAPTAVVASGDGGWVHLGPYVAEYLAGQGYFVVGFDSKAYLTAFTKDGRTLTTRDVPGDFRLLVEAAVNDAAERPVLIGVSEGAALAVLAATDEPVKSRVAGVLALGLPEKAELGWRFRDSVIYVTKGVPKEPLFDTTEVVGKLAPLPLVAIHSSQDEFVPLDEVRRVMERALEPKQLWVIEARNHRFTGNEPELKRKLLEAIAWIKTAHR